jgi:hypothetical protein
LSKTSLFKDGSDIEKDFEILWVCYIIWSLSFTHLSKCHYHFKNISALSTKTDLGQ